MVTMMVTKDGSPDEATLEDYFRYGTIGVLLLFFLLGAPVNLYVFQKLQEGDSKQRRSVSFTPGVPKSFQILQRHLNISDLMILCVYVPSHLCWKVMSVWRGGQVLCSLVAGANVLCFHLSSNIIVCIAIDKTLPTKWRYRRHVGHWMAVIAWSLAITISIPNLFLWTANHNPGSSDRAQCVPIENVTEPTGQMIQAYYYIHLATIFWIPALIIAICYTVVITRMTCVSPVPTTLNRIRDLRYRRLSRRDNSDSSKRGSLFIHTNDAMAPNHLAPLAQDLTPTYHTAHRGSRSSSVSVYEAKIRTSVSSTVSNMTGRAFCLSAALVLTYIVCWLPYSIYGLVPQGYRTPYFALITQLFVLNSVINPFLYGYNLKLHKMFKHTTDHV